MAALTTLMTRFCAGEDSWLARSTNTASKPGISEARDSNGKPRRNKHKRQKYGENAKIRQLMPGSGAQSPVSGKGHPKIKIRVHPVWTAYSIANAKFMAPQERQPPIPTENVGSSNKPTRQAPKRKRGLKAMIATKSPDHRTQEGKRNFPRKSKR